MDVDDTLGQVILVNSRFVGNRNISDNMHDETDDTRFVTAHEQLIIDPMKNNFIQSYEKTSCSQVLPKPAAVHHRNVRYFSSDVYDLEVFC